MARRGGLLLYRVERSGEMLVGDLLDYNDRDRLLHGIANAPTIAERAIERGGE